MEGLPIERESDVITKELIETAIRHKEKEDNIYVTEFTISPGTKDVVHFCSVVLSVRATVLQKGVETTHFLIFKIPYSNGVMREWIENQVNFFTTESHAYIDVIPAMVRLQEEMGLDAIRPPVPLHYYSIVEETGGVVIVEDLRHKGFVHSDLIAGLDETHCRLVMKELANFHALSFALKNGDPRNMEKFHEALQEVFLLSPFPDFLSETYIDAIELVKRSSRDENVLMLANKLEAMKMSKLMKDQLKPIEPYAVICHGDVWFNNLLFKYEINDGKKNPVDIRFLDLQELRYALPTTDLVNFFYSSTTKTMRDKHLSDLLGFYHFHFTKNLIRLNKEASSFTLDVLEQLFKRNIMYGVIVSCAFISVLLNKPENKTNLANCQYEPNEDIKASMIKRLLANEQNQLFIQERLVGSFEDAIEMDLL